MQLDRIQRGMMTSATTLKRQDTYGHQMEAKFGDKGAQKFEEV